MELTREQKEARSRIMQERAKNGLSTDIDEMIEYYRKIDPEYAERLEAFIGPSAKRGQE